MISFVVVVQPQQEIHSTQPSSPRVACSIVLKSPTVVEIVAEARVRQGGQILASRRPKEWIVMYRANPGEAEEVGRGALEAEAPSADDGVPLEEGAKDKGKIKTESVVSDGRQGWLEVGRGRRRRSWTVKWKITGKIKGIRMGQLAQNKGDKPQRRLGRRMIWILR